MIATAICLALYSLAGCGAPIDQDLERRFADGLFTSDTLPAITIAIDDAFDYVGRLEIPLEGIADAERHVFIDSAAGRVRRMIVLQFEGVRDHVDPQTRYQARIPPAGQDAGSNFRYTTEFVSMGGFSFVHNTWAFSNRASIHENPEAESAKTTAFLADRGWLLDDGLVMSRFMTPVGPGDRNELIIFYFENLADHGLALADVPDGEPPTGIFDRLSSTVVERARAAFEVVSADR